MIIKSLMLGVASVTLLGAAATAWAAESAGSGLVCVPIQNIDSTPAIDDKTILLVLKGHRYKRIDLYGSCPDILFHGFSFTTPETDDLCTSAGLRVVEPGGGPTCMIKDIIDITPDEAQALRKQAKR